MLLCDRLRAVQSSLESHEGELSRVAHERDQVDTELSERQERAPLAAQRFRFYQEMRGYVTDLVECLDEKVGLFDVLGKRQTYISVCLCFVFSTLLLSDALFLNVIFSVFV